MKATGIFLSFSSRRTGGVEVEPGRKDHAAMTAFFENAQPAVAESGLPQA